MATKRTGRPRGRPAKQRAGNFEKRKARGRPRLDLRDDPDRFVIAVIPVMNRLFNLNQRDSVAKAIALLGSTARAETIRSKGRRAWSELRHYHQRGLAHENSSDLRKLWKRRKWLNAMYQASYLAIKSTVDTEQKQTLTRLLNLAELAGEKRFAAKVLVPLLHDKTPLITLLYYRSEA